MKTPQERKENSERIIRAKGIGVFEGLPMAPSAGAVRLKNIDEICKRAIAALLSTQIACEISNQHYDKVKFFIDYMKYFQVMDVLNEKEKKLVNGLFQPQDVMDIIWEYECYWAVVWALGLVDDAIQDADQICDCDKAISLVVNCKSYEDFKNACKLRDIEEILDMLDLFYRYHWACVQHRWVDEKCPVGNLNEEIVFERRRGLEWLISEEDDWYDIALHT
ncbi:MAG: DUF4272 domain-containing protein [Oscillospiraceae bacterium]|nr:DUF4272 domain-containing protein [Oscillospiraceae bacterium]